MVLLETKSAPGNGSGAARECLVVEASVRDRPVQVLLSQGLPPEATVVGDPTTVVKVALRAHDRCLVGKEFRCLVGEASGQERRHHRKALDPHGYVLDRRAGRDGRLARSVWKSVIDGDVRHLHKLQFKNFLGHLGWQGRRGGVRAPRGEPRCRGHQVTEGCRGRVTERRVGGSQGRCGQYRSSPACCEPAAEAGVKIGTELERENLGAEKVPGRGQQEEGGGSES